MSLKEAYFKLKMWAVDERQMRDRSQKDVEMAQSYYEFLKSYGGVYYESLQKSGWAQAFEAIQK